MSKQDRQGVRTAADVERKYSLGEIGEASKRSTKAEKQVSELDQRMNLFMSSVNKTIADMQNRINSFYPVGSIYISADAKNPSELFGGVWERIEDRFLLAAGDSYAAGETGGEAEHTLTAEEMPSHNHGWATQTSGSIYDEPWPDWEWRASATQSPTTPDSVAGHTDFQGGDQPHNNMPPYLAVYVWRRVS